MSRFNGRSWPYHCYRISCRFAAARTSTCSLHDHNWCDNVSLNSKSIVLRKTVSIGWIHSSRWVAKLTVYPLAVILVKELMVVAHQTLSSSLLHIQRRCKGLSFDFEWCCRSAFELFCFYVPNSRRCHDGKLNVLFDLDNGDLSWTIEMEYRYCTMIRQGRLQRSFFWRLRAKMLL
jgi:hypothetical protein